MPVLALAQDLKYLDQSYITCNVGMFVPVCCWVCRVGDRVGQMFVVNLEGQRRNDLVVVHQHMTPIHHVCPVHQ